MFYTVIGRDPGGKVRCCRVEATGLDDAKARAERTMQLTVESVSLETASEPEPSGASPIELAEPPAPLPPQRPPVMRDPPLIRERPISAPRNEPLRQRPEPATPRREAMPPRNAMPPRAAPILPRREAPSPLPRREGLDPAAQAYESPDAMGTEPPLRIQAPPGELAPAQEGITTRTLVISAGVVVLLLVAYFAYGLLFPPPPPPKPPAPLQPGPMGYLDRSAQAQAERRTYIQQVISKGTWSKVVPGPTAPEIWVLDPFMKLPPESMRGLCTLVYEWNCVESPPFGNNDTDAIVLVQAETHNRVGTYAPRGGGLKLE